MKRLNFKLMLLKNKVANFYLQINKDINDTSDSVTNKNIYLKQSLKDKPCFFFICI